MRPKARRFLATKEMASCMQVMRVLQAYLDGQADELTARRVANHLAACRRCGLEAATYREIKRSLARRGAPADPGALERLRAFASALSHRSEDETGPGEVPPPA
jgi:anti-sigma factor RsiW